MTADRESIRVWDDGVVYNVHTDGSRERVVPEGWVEVARMPKGKYVVVEEADAWVCYCEDDHGAFS